MNFLIANQDFALGRLDKIAPLLQPLTVKKMADRVAIICIDILPVLKGTGILLESPLRITGSASPFTSNPLRVSIQRWFSQATFWGGIFSDELFIRKMPWESSPQKLAPQSFTPLQKYVPVCPTVQFKPN